MKSTKEKIGLIMLAVTGIGALIGVIFGAFAQSFWIGITVSMALLWFSTMIIFIFDE